jgi:hypothetical protein
MILSNFWLIGQYPYQQSIADNIDSWYKLIVDNVDLICKDPYTTPLKMFIDVLAKVMKVGCQSRVLLCC